ncbi:MAG: prepilin-type N-terminal cleavage/methylation domain-containing protein [Phycisphaerales bacterium]|nr:prepilin-type N-terminal cleavage/methylation domain-containing protein [Phycisphaerales bacterium]
MKSHRLGRQKASGFTLVELLVVLAVIVILVSIMVPAVSAARNHAKKAQASAQLAGISTAINMYFQIFDAYPGPYGPLDTTTASSARKLTGTQNLLLGLAFGMYDPNAFGNNPNPYPDAVNPINPQPMPTSAYPIGGSSISYFVDAAKPFYVRDLSSKSVAGTVSGAVAGVYKTYPAFYSVGANTLSPAGVSDSNGNWTANNWQPSGVYTNYPEGRQGSTDTAKGTTSCWAFPTIVDTFDDPLPILYYRRTPGVEGTGTVVSNYPNLVNTMNSPPIVSMNTSTLASYYLMDNADYTNASGQGSYILLSTPSGSTFGQSYNNWTDGKGNLHVFNELVLADRVSTFVGTTATARGGYVLISAGIDRFYGNVGVKGARSISNATDDIVVVGP